MKLPLAAGGPGEEKPEEYLKTSYSEGSAAFSPGGRWVAFESNESGQMEIYIQGYPDMRGKWLGVGLRWPKRRLAARRQGVVLGRIEWNGDGGANRVSGRQRAPWPSPTSVPASSPRCSDSSAQRGRTALPGLRAGVCRFGERTDGGGPELGGAAGEMTVCHNPGVNGG
jgi:hypothetical protein